MTTLNEKSAGAPGKSLAGTGFAGSLAALGVATCCVAPMGLMLFGLGGSWLAVFGKIAAVSFYVLAVSSLILAAAWVVAYRSGSVSRLRWWLMGGTVMTVLAWVIFAYEGRINDYLITWM